MYDFVVVGGGIGGASAAAMLSKNHKTLLIEKEPYLGGCSGTFSRGRYKFNIGATTFAMYQDGMILKNFFDECGIQFEIEKIEIPITVIQNDKTSYRYTDLKRFESHISQIYPNDGHAKFWKDIYEISKLFHQKTDFYYNKSGFFELLKTSYSFLANSLIFVPYIIKSAKKGLRDYFGELDDDFYDYLENQFLIVAQTKIEDANFLTLALALSYPFFDNFYVTGGMGRLFDEIEKKIYAVNKKESFLEIQNSNNTYKVKTNKGEYETKQVIFNTMYKNDFVEKKELTQSAFVVYCVIKSDKSFHHHYQIIEKNIFSYCISNSMFISFSDQNDNEMAPLGEYSVTISVHTDIGYWQNLSKEDYKNRKSVVEGEILKKMCDKLNINSSQLINKFSATPQTFSRYINRQVLGGLPLKAVNFAFGFSSPKVNDFYYCGDNVFPAQGWPGVVAGVVNLKKVLNV